MNSTMKNNPKRRISPLFIAAGLIVILFIAYWLLVSHLIPTWPERGLFGDAFGALNAFVSGVALIGVVYALYLQQRQLDELRRSIELQQQPVLAIDASEFRIDRPRAFTSPDSPSCEALSRYHCGIAISNVSEMPAINIVVNARLFFPRDAGEEAIASVGYHFPMIVSETPRKETIMLVPRGSPTSLFEVLRRKDAFALPCVSIELFYRNLLGACFTVRQAYHVVALSDIDADLKSWHAAISSFTATYQEELAAMAKDETAPGLFYEIKERFAAVAGKKDYLSLDLVPIPGAFEARAVTQEHYHRYVNSVGLPRLTFPDTECPIGDRAKKQQPNQPFDRTR